jgi:DNA-directed RNA polymerase I, II, and III subunit RPABC2
MDYEQKENDDQQIEQQQTEGFDVVMQNGDTTTVKKQKERTTTPYMTKYERARILGTRALQIRYANMLIINTN